MKTRFNYPTRIVFGQGVVEDIPNELISFCGKRPLLVTDHGLMKTDIPEKIVALLKTRGIEVLVFSDVSPNPKGREVENGAEAYKKHQADCIIAVGGGSPMDAGKAIQMRHISLHLHSYPNDESVLIDYSSPNLDTGSSYTAHNQR